MALVRVYASGTKLMKNFYKSDYGYEFISGRHCHCHCYAYEITFPENVMVDNIGSGRGTAPPGL